jgi:nitrogen-specific signal transduction histidine kinase
LMHARAAVSSHDLRVSVFWQDTGEATVLEIADNGPGVPPELVPRLFTPFVSGRSDGHGLGLALARKLVEAHAGTLTYRAGSPAGAVFRLEVPRLS